MRKSKINYPTSTIFVLVFFFILYFSFCSPGDWRIYQTSEFTIEFPGNASDTVTLVGNTASAKTYFEPAPGSLDSNLYYSISLYSLPDSLTILGNDLNAFFKMDAKIYAWGIDGVLADSGRVVKSGNVNGMEFKVFLPNSQGITTVRKFAIGKHLYTLLVVTENMKINN